MTSNSYSKLLFGNFFAPSNKTYISSSTKRQSENKANIFMNKRKKFHYFSKLTIVNSKYLRL